MFVSHVEDDVHISALDAFYEMDGRKSLHIGEVLERHRGEDAGDLRHVSTPSREKFAKVIRRS